MMKLVLGIVTFALFSAACAGKKTTETGPKLSAHVTCNFDAFDSPSQGGSVESTSCAVSSTNDYEISIEIDTDDGKQEDDPAPSTGSEPTFPAQALNVTFTVNGQAFSPAPTFTPDPGFESSRSTSNMVVVPGTSKGQSVVLHAQTQDSRGLKSNPIDITFPLN